VRDAEVTCMISYCKTSAFKLTICEIHSYLRD
jgi:hypothetical protein